MHTHAPAPKAVKLLLRLLPITGTIRNNTAPLAILLSPVPSLHTRLMNRGAWLTALSFRKSGMFQLRLQPCCSGCFGIWNCCCCCCSTT